MVLESSCPLWSWVWQCARHVLEHATGRARKWGAFGATFAAALSFLVFIGQLIGKWHEGGWAALISFSILAILAHLMLLSPLGFREPQQIHRIVREKAVFKARWLPLSNGNPSRCKNTDIHCVGSS
jgi:hypothetical protein